MEPQRWGRVPKGRQHLQEVPGVGGSYARNVGRFLIRRLLFTVFVLFIVSLITFVIFVKLPASDPARRATGRATTEENIEAAREAFGIFGAFFIAIANLCVDIAYAYVDPRVRFS
jgi:ABC-type dipeptide/oligopeptide/nickel transport system permease component